MLSPVTIWCEGQGFIGDGKYQVQCIKIIVTKINEGIIYMLVAAICVTNYNDDLITKAQWVGCFQYRPGSVRLLKKKSVEIFNWGAIFSRVFLGMSSISGIKGKPYISGLRENVTDTRNIM